MLVAEGNYTEVETITLAYLKDHPDFLPGLRTLARNVYFPQNRLADALATQQRVVQVGANDPNVYDDHRVLAILLRPDRPAGIGLAGSAPAGFEQSAAG